MNSQFLFIALSIFTADNSLLRFLSHKVLLFWESALLTPCYNLAMADIGRPTIQKRSSRRAKHTLRLARTRSWSAAATTLALSALATVQRCTLCRSPLPYE